MTWHPYNFSFYEYLQYICVGDRGCSTLGAGRKSCYTCLILLLILIEYLYMSGMWFIVASRTYTKKHVLHTLGTLGCLGLASRWWQAKVQPPYFSVSPDGAGWLVGWVSHHLGVGIVSKRLSHMLNHYKLK